MTKTMERKPFWDERLKEQYAQLPLPIPSGSTGESRCSSWFPTKNTSLPGPSSPETAWRSRMSFRAGAIASADTMKRPKKRKRRKSKTGDEGDDQVPAYRVRKVRLRLTRYQTGVLRYWMGGARFVYNKGVDHVRKTGRANRTELRRLFAAEKSPLVTKHPVAEKGPLQD